MGASVASRRTRVLVLTGEIELLRLVRSVIEPGGCIVCSAGVSSAPHPTRGTFDIVIIDLPDLDLEDLGEAKRAHPEAQFIAICGGYREADCIAVLDMDVDYLPRPFRVRDLSARVRVAALRRFNATRRRRYYRHGSLVIDLFNREVAMEGEPLALAPSELRVLTLLASEAGHVATFSQILAALGRDDSASERKALRSSVFRLRRRIERDPRRPNLVLTEAGVGYRLASETDDVSGLDLRAPRRDGEENRSS